MSRNKPEKPRVFCIGWHKTGTSSIGIALLELGYNVLGCRLDMAEPLLYEDLETPLELAGEYDAVQDVPWAALYRELDQRYPKSKFILTSRNESEWMNSALSHFNDLDVQLHKWLYGNGVMKGNEQLYLTRYLNHNQSVRAYFSGRSNFIEMDFKNGDGWIKLCSFLEESIPKKPFPHVNKGSHNFSLKDKMLQSFRKILPESVRNIRIMILKNIGLHKGKNRFNNQVENRKITK